MKTELESLIKYMVTFNIFSSLTRPYKAMEYVQGVYLRLHNSNRFQGLAKKLLCR